MKIIVTAGGTGGHINPALAIINKFKEKEKDLDVIYIGTHNRMEKDIVPKSGIKYIPIEIYGFSKTKILRDFKNIGLIFKAKKKCIEIMKEFKPDVVIGTGGYVTFPVIKAAKSLNIKTVLHEQNSIPGKTNIFLSKIVDLVCISFKNSTSHFHSSNVVYSGNPCGDYAINGEVYDKTKLGFSKDKRLIIIVAGSLGSSSLNEKFKTYLSLVGNEDYEILYITGKDLYDKFMENSDFPKNVKVVPYFDNLSSLMKSADLIITRAGASTLSEIISLNIPSILIPSPYVSNNHQYYNALDLVNMGVAILLEEKNLNPETIQISINELMNNPEKYKKMKNNLKKISDSKAADIIYDNIKGLLK